MGNKMKKLLCALLASAMLVTSVGVVSFAENEDAAGEVTVTEAATETAEGTEAEATEAPAETEATEAPAETEATEATEAPAEPTEAPVVTAVTSTGSSYDNDAYYQKALALCSSLGIISGYEDGSIKPDSNVTRAEMNSIVLRMLAVNSYSAYQNVFTDVASSHWAADQIQTGYDASVISGMGDGTFQPDSEVLYAQVIVMLVNAMGYSTDAAYYGGYPDGYIKVAGDNSLNLLKNAPGASDVACDRGTVIKMVYNALLGDYKQIIAYKDGQPEYGVKTEHPSLAYAKFDVIDTTGILYGTSKTSIGNDDLQDGEIEILPKDEDKSQIFNTTLKDLEDYIGQEITYYYRENAGRVAEVVAVAETTKSETYVIDDMDDIDSITGFDDGAGSIKITGQGKAKDCAGATIVYNGKVISNADLKTLDEEGISLDDLLKPELGTIKLVKSNKNDNYNVVFVDAYETVIVSSTGTDRLTGKVSAGTEDNIGATAAYSLNLDDTIDRTVTVKKEGEEIKLKNLKKNDVASIRASLDNSVVDIIVTGEKITGQASSISKKLDDTHATVNGTRYEVANIAVGDLKTGSQSVFYLDAFGRIAYIESDSSGLLQTGEKYGWIMNAYYAENGSDYVVQMMTTDGKVAELQTGSKLDYWAPDATKATSLSGEDNITDTIHDLVADNGFLASTATYEGYNDKGKKTNLPVPIRLVKYKTSSSNTLSRLYCAVDSTSVDDEDALRIDPKNLNGVAVVASLVGGYKITDGIMELSVPKDPSDMKDAANYKIGTVNSGSYVVRENGSTRNYNVGEFEDRNVASILINYTASADALANLGDIDTNGNNPVMVVEKIDSGVDDDDNTVYTVHGYVNGAEAEFTTTKNTVLGKISTTAAIIDNARDYLTTSLWDAKNGAADGSDKEFTEIVEEGDLILYDTGERLIQLLDADDVYNVVVNGAATKGLLFGSFNPFPARNMFAFGALLESDLTDNASLQIDTPALNNLEFDPAKLMDTIDININSGKADVDTEGSEISDLITFDEETKTGDYVFARFADKGTLQEVIVYRFEK